MKELNIQLLGVKVHTSLQPMGYELKYSWLENKIKDPIKESKLANQMVSFKSSVRKNLKY